jgi:hypothetical protein
MLSKRREALVAQQQKALAVYHQATGAVALIDSLVEEIGVKSVTIDQLKEMLGAESVELTPQPPKEGTAS